MGADEQRERYQEQDVTTAEASGDRESRPTSSATLLVVHGPDARLVGRRFQLGDNLLVVGREVDGDGVCVDDRHMSRIHARFTFDTRAQMFRVGDAQSRNGTLVNGRRQETVLLSDGDVIRTGDTLFVYVETEPMERAKQYAEGIAKTDMHVLVRGETGTGKEVLSRLIHRASKRAGELVAVNCASIPADLAAAELFGHTKHAFSGAAQVRPGLFVAANRGTLLLDEVGDCPLELQAALLRAIQEKQIRPVGSDREVPVDVRIIAATNVDLEAAVTRGRFRADLYARLSQSQIMLPPLRARRSELLSLLAEQVPDGTPAFPVSADAAEALLLWSWPLNVRELQTVVRSHIALRGASLLDLAALAKQAPAIAAPLYERKRASPGQSSPSTLPPSEIRADRTKLRGLLEQHGGNVSAVADALGKPRAQVYRWMKSLGLSVEKFRG